MAITANQRILTLNLWKLASELKVGDWVFNSDGKLVQIKLVQHFVSQDCFEVTFDDHLTIQGNSHLAFCLENTKYRNRLFTYKGVRKFKRPLKRYNVLEAMESNERLSLPTTKPIGFPTQALAIPPFIFGFWFFNRRHNKTLLPPPGMSEFVHQKFKDHGYKITIHRKMPTNEYEFRCHPSIESQLFPDIPKNIPNNYLFCSAEQRIELLSGIIHGKSRQYNPKTNWFVFTTRNYTHSGQIRFIVESLGSKTTTIEHNKDKRREMLYRSKIKLIQNQTSKPIKVHYGRRYLQQITPIGPQSCVHIEIDDENSTFLVGEGFISTC